MFSNFSSYASVNKEKSEKKKLIFTLFLIYEQAFFNMIMGYKWLAWTYGITLFLWYICIEKYIDRVCILDKSMVDIYLKNGDVLKRISVSRIKRSGEWLIINKTNTEIRMKESDITRVEYYGEPLIVVL